MILLCEDDPQERLVRSFLKECGLNTEPPYFVPRNASREVHGGTVGWVLREFAKELRACRQRHNTKANTLLIVVADADAFTVVERRSHLVADPPTVTDDPLVVLIPRRHIETWIRAAMGESVNETDSYKKPEPKKSEIRAAAKEIHGWARGNPSPGPTCVPSLQAALAEWRKIG
jgi:hypothetical protein